MFGVPNAKYLAFSTPDKNAFKNVYLIFDTSDENTLKNVGD